MSTTSKSGSQASAPADSVLPLVSFAGIGGFLLGSFILSSPPDLNNGVYTGIAAAATLAAGLKTRFSETAKAAVLIGAIGATQFASGYLPRISLLDTRPQVEDSLGPLAPLSPLKFN